MLWQSLLQATSFFHNLHKLIKFYKAHCKRKARAARLEEVETHQDLQHVNADLDTDPASYKTQAMQSISQLHLQALEACRVADRHLQSRIPWKTFDDAMTKDFFLWVRDRLSPSLISALENDHGEVVIDAVGIEDICFNFYRRLYSAPEVTLNKELAGSKLLEKLSPIITKPMRLELDRPLTQEKLQEACKKFAYAKSPGPDGIVVDMFQQYWEFIGPNYTRIVQKSIQQGRFPMGVTKG